MASRVGALVWAAIASIAVAACGRGEARIETAADTAASESGVPVELLLAMAYVESRATTDGPGQWIPLGSRHAARRGAALIGAAVEELEDPGAVLRAAAALLADAARETGVGRGAALAAWRPALERFAGGRDALARELFADQVFTILARGFETATGVVRVSDLEPSVTQGARFPQRPAQIAGAAFTPYMPLAETAQRPPAADARHPRFIVVHTMQSTLPVILDYFRRPGTTVGAHYVVDSVAGTTVQMADERLVVFHDACFNEESIGIEHEGYVEAGKRWYSDEQLRASARLVRDIARRNDIPLDRSHILGHGEAPDCSDHTDPGPDWDWARFMADVEAADAE
ncbi:MAG TPA: peptidoglycan recognition family protein [Kofleriaceae bacterium]|jgi:hypothetical protein|nr:peptidoglycan recognition family protein [Kofleriaceae bacterium]